MMSPKRRKTATGHVEAKRCRIDTANAATRSASDGAPLPHSFERRDHPAAVMKWTAGRNADGERPDGPVGSVDAAASHLVPPSTQINGIRHLDARNNDSSNGGNAQGGNDGGGGEDDEEEEDEDEGEDEDEDEDVQVQGISKAESLAWFGPDGRNKLRTVVASTPPELLVQLIELLRGGATAAALQRTRLFQLLNHRRYHQKKARRLDKCAKSDFFWETFDVFKLAMRLGTRDELVKPFAEMLNEVMDTFEHPNDIQGYRAFTAMAELCALCRGKAAVFERLIESASRLTLGAPFTQLTTKDKDLMGADILLELVLLHSARRDWLDDIAHSWNDGKFRTNSTCTKCGVDPWEEFLLIWPLAMTQSGKSYLSDDSDAETDRDEDSDDDEVNDDNEVISIASDTSDQPGPDEYTKIKHRRYESLLPGASFTSNYGPNAHVLKIYSMGQFDWTSEDDVASKPLCYSCGYRRDGGLITKTCRFFLDIERALGVARQQIKALPERIDLSRLQLAAPGRETNGAIPQRSLSTQSGSTLTSLTSSNGTSKHTTPAPACENGREQHANEPTANGANIGHEASNPGDDKSSQSSGTESSSDDGSSSSDESSGEREDSNENEEAQQQDSEEGEVEVGGIAEKRQGSLRVAGNDSASEYEEQGTSDSSSGCSDSDEGGSSSGSSCSESSDDESDSDDDGDDSNNDGSDSDSYGNGNDTRHGSHEDVIGSNDNGNASYEANGSNANRNDRDEDESSSSDSTSSSSSSETDSDSDSDSDGSDDESASSAKERQDVDSAIDVEDSAEVEQLCPLSQD